MKLLIIYHLSFYILTLSAKNVLNSRDNVDNKFIECPCPYGIDDECTKQPICVYGINDAGEIFHNGKNDVMNLTNIALQRKAEINNTDDVLVNLYNPQIRPMAIFYYGCQRCDDLKQIGNITVPKLQVFLLSLYNQRMKYNIKYSQSDFIYYNDSMNEQQTAPEINVRPFWQNRLILNQSCAHKQQSFTQKHYIPAFLTQDLCFLDYKSVSYLQMNETYQTQNGQIIYSPTLSYIDLYSFNVLSNSSNEIPADDSGEREVCKITFNLKADARTMRFFCLCPTNSCTLKVTQKNPLHCCPYKLNITFDADSEYSSLNQTSDYMPVNEFFLQYEELYCYFQWLVDGTKMSAYIQRDYYFGFLDGYKFLIDNRICPFKRYEKESIGFIEAIFYRNDSKALRDVFLKTTIDHSRIIGDIKSVGANCSSEGPLSHPSYSRSYGSNSEMFPCYKYFDLYSLKQVFPVMGINILPITILAKGKECYYYSVKSREDHLNACHLEPPLSPFMVIGGCLENATIDMSEVERMRKIINACPTMKPNETQWKYQTTTNLPVNLCGQFLRGLKLKNGKYVPEEVELRQITNEDSEMIESANITYFHGCAFNASQKLTICTCYSALGGCENVYAAGRIYLLRYLPFKGSNI